jgi:hypothetical protein
MRSRREERIWMEGEIFEVFEAKDLGGEVFELVHSEGETFEVGETANTGRKLFELVLTKPEMSKIVETEHIVRERVGYQFVPGEVDIESNCSCNQWAGGRRRGDSVPSRRFCESRCFREGRGVTIREHGGTRLNRVAEVDWSAGRGWDSANARKLGNVVGDVSELFLTVSRQKFRLDSDFACSDSIDRLT